MFSNNFSCKIVFSKEDSMVERWKVNFITGLVKVPPTPFSVNMPPAAGSAPQSSLWCLVWTGCRHGDRAQAINNPGETDLWG